MQVAILSGIAGRVPPDLIRSVPVNLAPVTEPGDGQGTGVSRGYLRTPPGVRQVREVMGASRGGVVWRERHYRVFGPTLYRVADDGTMTALGSVDNDGRPAKFAQAFDRLGIVSANRLFYVGATDAITEVTDPDLGEARSLAWSDGYFLTTDGEYIIATNLNDPTSIDPLHYGSSEADPDPVVGLLALRGEVYALNRYTIEVFLNQGGTGFPFARNRGAQIPKGCVGRDAFAPFVETFAFVGSARNEAPSVYLAGSGQGIRIAPRALDLELATLTDAQLERIEVESRVADAQTELLIHLPDVTWVYSWVASQQLDIPVWYKLAGGVEANQPYAARHATIANGVWWVGKTGALGRIDATLATVFGEAATYRFDTPLVYNASMRAVVHSLELVSLGGRGAETDAPWIAVSHSDDGETWGQERIIALGRRGDRDARVTWRRMGTIRRWRSFRFRGQAVSPVSFTRLNADVEPLDG